MIAFLSNKNSRTNKSNKSNNNNNNKNRYKIKCNKRPHKSKCKTLLIC